ncbi:MAG: hypothetical protein LKM32_12715 [Chiayiivirga sp.]|uniref:hypothetical protein n=1 Tax=Chiayiivirga sp. TaxID=2041042 RepID=UPI0025B9066A|nr:hypothetical protein [Chiayiivirga sp.]MCI1730201.1 hypothetical protein [Chiayiivirga sp.]
MADKIEASVVYEANGAVVQLWVRDPDLAGKEAVFTLGLQAQVKRASPVHRSEVLLERRFTLAPGQNRIRLGEVLDRHFVYRGQQLDLLPNARVEIDDGLVFDTKLDLDVGPACKLPPRHDAPEDHASVHSPRDRFSFIANLRAIPAKSRAIVLWLVIVGLPVIALNAVVGVRDQFVPDSQVWFYDHRGDDGSESPLMKALMGSGGVGMALWLAIRRQLQKYMRFEARLPVAGQITRGSRCRVADMIEGVARVPLQQARVRVVAFNREHGQYTATEGSGKNKRRVTRSFTNNARGLVLYERLLGYVPANMPLADHLDGEVDFTSLFDALYPPWMLGGTHGLSIRIEAQFLHPDYVDHEVELDPGQLDEDEFHHRK